MILFKQRRRNLYLFHPFNRLTLHQIISNKRSVNLNNLQLVTNLSVSVLNRRTRWFIKRNLSSAFTPITEDDDALNPSEKQSISESESMGFISLSSTASGLGGLTPSSSPSLITDTTEDMNSFNIQSMVNDLRESMSQVLNSADLEPNYKKLFDALVVKMVLVEELHSLHEEKDVFIVLMSFVLAAIVTGSVGFFMFSDAQSSYYGPPPT